MEKFRDLIQKHRAIISWTIVWIILIFILQPFYDYISSNNNTNNSIINIDKNLTIPENNIFTNEIIVIPEENIFEEKIKSIKEKYNIRELLPLEAWKWIDKTPINTYFWIEGTYLSIYQNDINKYETRNIKFYEDDFEILYINKKTYVIWFTSKDIASNIISSKLITIKSYKYPDLSFNTAVIIPLDKIKDISSRYIWINKNEDLTKIYDISIN